MSKLEYISLAGLRLDGRRPGELRDIEATLNHDICCDGSVLLEIGQSKVVACVMGPREVDRRSRSPTTTIFENGAQLNVEVTTSPFSGLERKRKRGNIFSSLSERKNVELAITIKQTLESVIMFNLYPKSQIDIIINVLYIDGSLLSSCLNAATLALADAGISMKDLIFSCSVASFEGHHVMDVTRLEENSGALFMPLAILSNGSQIANFTSSKRETQDTTIKINKREEEDNVDDDDDDDDNENERKRQRLEILKHEKIVLLQSQSRIDVEQLEDLVLTGVEGAKKIGHILKSKLRKHSVTLFKQRQALDVNFDVSVLGRGN